MSRLRRVFHPAPVEAGNEPVLDRAESHHLAEVLRARAGDEVSVFDGCGREWRAEVLDPDPRRVRLRLGEELLDRVEPQLVVRLYQALCRPERIDWLVQKATEVGFTSLHPVRTSRVEARDPSPSRLERWRRIATEACKQSGRRRVLVLSEPGPMPAPTAGAAGLLLDAAGGPPPLADVLEDVGPATEVWLAVGPEGGFTADEIKALTSRGWQRAGLGPRTLRTETAGLVAGAIVLHLWGDLGSRSAGQRLSGR